MLVKAILISLVAAFTMFDYQLGTLYAFRPIVTCPLVGLILGNLPAGLAIGASFCSWETSPLEPTFRLTRRWAVSLRAPLP